MILLDFRFARRTRDLTQSHLYTTILDINILNFHRYHGVKYLKVEVVDQIESQAMGARTAGRRHGGYGLGRPYSAHRADSSTAAGCHSRTVRLLGESFDVRASLRRSGTPDALTPTDLYIVK